MNKIEIFIIIRFKICLNNIKNPINDNYQFKEMGMGNLFNYILKLGFSLFAIYLCMRYSSRFNLLDFSKDSNQLINSSINQFQKDTILNITNLQQKQQFNNISLQHFQFLQFKPISNKQLLCQEKQNKKPNSFLLINTNAQTIGYKYLNLIKVLVKQKLTKKQSQNDKQNQCINFRIFGLVQKKTILMNVDKSLINKYVKQIQYVIEQVSKNTPNKLTILASQQASIFTLQSFITIEPNQQKYSRILQKLNKIILINLYNLNKKILQQPSYIYIDDLKQKIIRNSKKLQFFNQLGMIMINTLKENNLIWNITEMESKAGQKQNNQYDYEFINKDSQQVNQSLLLKTKKNYKNYDHLSQYKSLSNRLFVFQNYQNQQQQIKDYIDEEEISKQLKSQEILLNVTSETQPQYFALNNTLFFHTKQMYNLHLQIDQGMYFLAYPFLKIISEFILLNNYHQITDKAIQYYFKYGQGHHQFPFEFIQNNDVKKQCMQMELKTLEPVIWNIERKCFKLNIRTKIKKPIILIYSNYGKFDLYSNSLVKIQQYDKNIDKSLYMIERMGEKLIVYNPNKLQISVAVSHIFSPSYPLTQIFSQFQIFYIGQMDTKTQLSIPKDYNIQKFVIRTCSDKILIFPDHFSVGKINRQFLLQQSDSQCYNQKNLFDLLMINIKQNWIIFRNIFFFSIFFVYNLNQWNFRTFFTLFVVNSLIFYGTEIRKYQILIVIGLVFMCEKVFNICEPIINLIHIDRKKIFISMIIILIIALICQQFLFQKYNYWKILLLFIIFFINKQNVIIICAKLYFLKQIIFYGIFDTYHIIQMILLLQCYISRYNGENGIDFQYSLKKSRFNYLEERIKNLGLIVLAMSLIFNPNTSYAKDLTDQIIWIKIVISFLEKIV